MHYIQLAWYVSNFGLSQLASHSYEGYTITVQGVKGALATISKDLSSTYLYTHLAGGLFSSKLFFFHLTELVDVQVAQSQGFRPYSFISVYTEEGIASPTFMLYDPNRKICKTYGLVGLLLWPIVFLIFPPLVLWVKVKNLMKPLGTEKILVTTKPGSGSSTPFPGI